MAVTIKWGNEAKTFTHFAFEGTWSWEEYYESRRKAMELVQDIPYTVNIVVEFTNSNFFPNNLLSNFVSSVEQAPRPFDVCVIVTNSFFLKAITKVISKLQSRIKFYLATSVEEAYAIMEKHDITVKKSA